MTDLEFGAVNVSDKVRRLVRFYRANDRKIRFIAMSSAVVTLALIVKFAFYNFDTVVATAGVITLDESVYTPFTMSRDFMVSPSDTRGSIRFPIADSAVNLKMQAINLVQGRNHAMEYLDKVGFTCIHLRHFDVRYDILVFKNVTMVNPTVLAESEERVVVKERALTGDIGRKKRPVWIRVSYYDVSLSPQTTTLWRAHSSCYAYYEF
jgi:hypothetical protein